MGMGRPRTLYIDHAATAPLRPEVARAMAPFLEGEFGNPSGSHEISRKAKNALEEARERVAASLGCEPSEVVFSGGGTEADNLALKGVCLSSGGGVVTSVVEHEAVLETAAFLGRQGERVVEVPVDATGRVDPERLASAIGDDTAVVSVMTANNETGSIQPITGISEAVAGRCPIHTDAVQSFISEDHRPGALGVDLMSLSAHKLGGPKGVGILYVRKGLELEPVIHGGGQELGRRSGTQNVMGAVGAAVAVEAAVADRERFRSEVIDARDRFEKLIADVAERTVPRENSLIQHSHLRFPGRLNETLLVHLDRVGVAASAGAACHSGAATVSHVLDAMGLDSATARECLRFSFGWTTTVEEAEEAARRILGVLQ